MDVERFIHAVSRRVEGLRRGVIIFVPPGSSRFEVVKRLRDLIDVVYAYREEAGVSKYQDVEQLAEAVAEALRGAGDRPVYRVAVVPRSTQEAVLLAKRLNEAKREDLQVKILYLPKYYAEAAENWRKSFGPSPRWSTADLRLWQEASTAASRPNLCRSRTR